MFHSLKCACCGAEFQYHASEQMIGLVEAMIELQGFEATKEYLDRVLPKYCDPCDAIFKQMPALFMWSH